MSRRGRALLPHPAPLTTPDGRRLVSRHLVAHVTGRHIDTVRKRIPPVACDVTTRVALLDLDEAAAALG